MPTIIDLRPEIEKISGRIAIVALLILCLCIKVYTTQFWHDMNVDHRVKCKVIDRIVEDETITQNGNSTTKKVNKLVLQAEGFNNTFKANEIGAIIATMWDTEATDSIFDKYR